MVWEIQRHDWSELRADRVPEALYALLRAKSEREATEAHQIIDSTVAVEGALYAAAVPTATCLITVLGRCTAAARPHVLEMLVQLGTGEPAQSEVLAGQQGLAKRCQAEIREGVALYLAILEIGNEREITYCVDLLGLCCQKDPALGPKVTWYFEKLLTEPVGEPLKDLTHTWLRTLRSLPRA